MNRIKKLVLNTKNWFGHHWGRVLRDFFSRILTVHNDNWSKMQKCRVHIRVSFTKFLDLWLSYIPLNAKIFMQPPNKPSYQLNFSCILLSTLPYINFSTFFLNSIFHLFFLLEARSSAKNHSTRSLCSYSSSWIKD